MMMKDKFKGKNLRLAIKCSTLTIIATFLAIIDKTLAIITSSLAINSILMAIITRPRRITHAHHRTKKHSIRTIPQLSASFRFTL